MNFLFLLLNKKIIHKFKDTTVLNVSLQDLPEIWHFLQKNK